MYNVYMQHVYMRMHACSCCFSRTHMAALSVSVRMGTVVSCVELTSMIVLASLVRMEEHAWYQLLPVLRNLLPNCCICITHLGSSQWLHVWLCRPILWKELHWFRRGWVFIQCCISHVFISTDVQASQVLLVLHLLRLLEVVWWLDWLELW